MEGLQGGKQIHSGRGLIKNNNVVLLPSTTTDPSAMAYLERGGGEGKKERKQERKQERKKLSLQHLGVVRHRIRHLFGCMN